MIPVPYEIADWRLRMSTLYADVRAETDARAAHAHWHRERSRLYREHPASPLSAETKPRFKTIPVGDYDPDWRFGVRLIPTAGEPLEWQLGADGSMRARPVAVTEGLGERLGQELTLFMLEGYGGAAFMPFADLAPTSYRGGRYLIDAIKGQDLGLDEGGRLILDFNFAVTPSCAWNDAYICPLAPQMNRVAAEVPVGERVPTG